MVIKMDESVIFGLKTGLNWQNDSLSYSQEIGLMGTKNYSRTSLIHGVKANATKYSIWRLKCKLSDKFFL